MASPMAPTRGMTIRPGSTNRAPMEKPTERARAGMANGQGGEDPGADDGQRGLDAGVGEEGDGYRGSQCEQDGEGGGGDCADRQHREQPGVPPCRQAGGHGCPEARPPSTNTCTGAKDGAVEHAEMERLLVLQRGQRREPGDGSGQEGQGDKDPPQYADLPHHPPGLAEGGGRLRGHRPVPRAARDRARRPPALATAFGR